MRQHRPVNAIAHSPDAVSDLEVTIGHLHDAALVCLAANRFEAKAFRIRLATNRNDYDIGVKHFSFTARSRLHAQLQFGFEFLDAGHFHAEAEIQALLLEDLLGFLGDVRIGTRHDAIEIFHHSHFRAETCPDRSHFETDHPGPDQDETFGN